MVGTTHSHPLNTSAGAKRFLHLYKILAIVKKCLVVCTTFRISVLQEFFFLTNKLSGRYLMVVLDCCPRGVHSKKLGWYSDDRNIHVGRESKTSQGNRRASADDSDRVGCGSSSVHEYALSTRRINRTNSQKAGVCILPETWLWRPERWTSPRDAWPEWKPRSCPHAARTSPLQTPAPSSWDPSGPLSPTPGSAPVPWAAREGAPPASTHAAHFSRGARCVGLVEMFGVERSRTTTERRCLVI